jgi:PEGA domain-containing protein
MKRKNHGTWMLLAAIGMLSLEASAQMPPQSAKLVILSEPSGATVTINDKKMNSTTSATFVVSPGTYVVSVAAGALVCPNITLTVTGGETLTRTCTNVGWK